MAFIYRRGLKNPEKADECRRLATEAAERIRDKELQDTSATRQASTDAPAAEVAPKSSTPASAVAAPAARQEVITIVSGLPRSGTSMIMQMLAAGGLEPFSDGQRAADEDNQRGYYEYEKVKAMAFNDNDWLGQACGKCIKIIAPLLKFLPLKHSYRVIFVERNLDEVLRSQRIMIQRHGQTGTKLTDDRLKEAFRKQVEVAKIFLARNGIPALYLPNDLCINQPEEAARQIRVFLGWDLDKIAMAGAVDAGLKRQKAAP
jgi:hypothetical protein